MSNEKCLARVSDGSWGRTHRCHHNAKKDGFCMIHHPDSVAARNKKAEEAYERKKAESPWTKLELVKKQRDKLLAALAAYENAGIGNSTDFRLQFEAHNLAVEALDSIKPN